MLRSLLAHLLSAGQLGLCLSLSLGLLSQDAAPQQAVLPAPQSPSHAAGDLHHYGPVVVSQAILAALETHPDDPVAAFLSLRPESAAELAAPRLLHIVGEKEAQWLTEGDKLRLRRLRRKFVDITDHVDFYARQQHAHMEMEASWAGKASKLLYLPGEHSSMYGLVLT